MFHGPLHPDPAALLAAAKHLWAGLEGATATLVNHSENHTFRMDCPSGQRFALRVHRPGHLDERAIRAELGWLAAIARDTPVPVVPPVPGRDGEALQRLPDGRLAVLFEWIGGREPSPEDDLAGLFVTLGRHAAHLHAHARATRPDPARARPRWDAEAVLGTGGAFGDWRKAPNLTPGDRSVIEAAAEKLWAELAAFGSDAHRFGLVHADMRLANLLVKGEQVTVLDFDDCGHGWFLYDFGASVSFFETDPRVPLWARSWAEGYEKVAPLAAEDRAMLFPMVLFRRIALLAWIGSHGETALAGAQAPHFARGTAVLAQLYLEGRGDYFA